MGKRFVIVQRNPEADIRPFYEDLQEATAALLAARAQHPSPETLQLVEIEEVGDGQTTTITSQDLTVREIPAPTLPPREFDDGSQPL